MSGETEACPACAEYGTRGCAICEHTGSVPAGSVEVVSPIGRGCELAAAQRELAGLARESVARDLALARLEAEVADLRAERSALYAVARAARAHRAAQIEALDAWDRLDGDVDAMLDWLSDGPVCNGAVRALDAALDALPCWCGRPDGHASGCARGER